jgi:DNA-binding transcriptional regulator PaaX
MRTSLPARRSKTLTKTLLLILASFGEGAVEFSQMFYGIQRGGWKFVQGGNAYVNELKRLRRKSVARNALESLKRSKYVKARKIGQQLIVELTDKGRAETLGQCLRSAKPQPTGTYTVIVFDIPESERANRKSLRLLLKQGGFKRLQQSVWVSDRDVHREMVGFVKRTHVQQWVNVFRASDFLLAPQ